MYVDVYKKNRNTCYKKNEELQNQKENSRTMHHKQIKRISLTFYGVDFLSLLVENFGKIYLVAIKTLHIST